jgi:hypothetical protein
MAADQLIIHRVLAGHAPMEVCDECPQPATDNAIRAAQVAAALRRDAPLLAGREQNPDG